MATPPTHLLIDRALEDQRVRHDLLANGQPGSHFELAARQGIAADDFDHVAVVESANDIDAPQLSAVRNPHVRVAIRARGLCAGVKMLMLIRRTASEELFRAIGSKPSTRLDDEQCVAGVAQAE